MLFKLFYYGDDENQNLLYNFNDILVKTVNTCNYLDTFEGVIFLNSIVWIGDTLMTYSNSFPDIIAEIINLFLFSRWFFKILDSMSILADLADFSTIVESLVVHHDEYNWGRLLAKALKLLTQFFASGTASLIWTWIE